MRDHTKNWIEETIDLLWSYKLMDRKKIWFFTIKLNSNCYNNNYLNILDNLFMDQKLVIKVFELGNDKNYHLHLICFTDKEYTKTQISNFILQKIDVRILDYQVKQLLHKGILFNTVNYLFKDTLMQILKTPEYEINFSNKFGFFGQEDISRDLIKSLNFDLKRSHIILERSDLKLINLDSMEINKIHNDIKLKTLLLENLHNFCEKKLH